MNEPIPPSLSYSLSYRSAEALEWKKFLELASEEACTERGKASLASMEDPLQWAPDIATARLLQQETYEASLLLDREGLWGPLTGLMDPATALDRLSRGAVLDLPELVLIRKWLYALDSWVQTPREEIRAEELFRKSLERLPYPDAPIRVLDRILTPEGELSERASPLLATLHAEVRSLKREISASLDQILRSLSQKGVLQDEYTDIRDGRYVLPVKISNQNEVEGTLYEASASRQTVFIEPKEIASLNNRLRQKHNELIQETYRVLAETTKGLKPYSDEIALSAEILSHWDAVQARARIGRRYGGKPITVTEEREFRLDQTAHPLLFWSLPPESIVRNEIEFNPPALVLLLTGPNTGGKTVFLKTLGLAGICARTGFPFPATEHPVVPFFTSFFADLGDPQSIERHLSSFSGHILRFKEILENLSKESLVLIDELNSATDPEEGAALGRAFLETLMARGAMTVATTHDPHLKVLAVSEPKILNASMEFDESARTPTYRIVLGVPGRSRALETAERLGLPAEVISLARNYLSREHTQIESLLAQMESDTHETTRARKEAVAIREEAERMRKEWLERTEASTQEMLDKARQRLRRVVEQAQDEVRSTVRRLEEVRTRSEVEKSRARLSEAESIAKSQLESAMQEEAPEITEALSRNKEAGKPRESEMPGELRAGMIVRVPKWKSTGTVLELSGNKAKVALGAMQVTLSTSEIFPTLGKGQKQPSKPSKVSVQRAESESRSLDLRGFRYDDAMSELERFLDVSFRTGAPEVTIIHGLGTGALREGTRKLLARTPYIRAFRDGGPGQGGGGATIVEFEL